MYELTYPFIFPIAFFTIFSFAFFRLSSPVLPSGNWINGYNTQRQYLSAVRRTVPREFQEIIILLTTSLHPLQPGPGTAIRNTAQAKLLSQAHSYITTTSTVPYPALVTATAPAQVHSPVPVQVPALALRTAQFLVLI